MSARERILVIGADAAGMSAAHQALRSGRALGRELEIIALEKTRYSSYSACGIPYWVAGDVPEYGELVARTPDQHRALGVDVRTGCTAVGLDLSARTVAYRDAEAERVDISYDQLIIATGASPLLPAWALRPDGRFLDGVGVLKDIDDGAAWIDWLTRPRQASAPVVVVGGGYVGVELAEAAMRRGHDVVLVTRSAVMSNLDPDMSARVETAMTEAGVTLIRDAVIVEAEAVDGRVTAVVTSTGERIACSLVAVATGVRPAVGFAAEAGLATGAWGGLQPDPTGALAPGVWAVGDCCEVEHRLTGQRVFLPLGTHANKQGKIVGGNVVGGDARFGGVLGTAVTRFARAEVTVEIGRTGLSTAEARAAGFDPVALATDGRTASGYMPEATPMATKVIADRSTRLLLGAQIVGGDRSAKRIDTIAAALWGRLTIDDMAGMDLAYAPPFATVWEAVQLAARRLADRF